MMHRDHPRAQGRASVPWPAGMSPDEDSCAVALELILARADPDGSLHPSKRVPWVDWGSPRPTLERLAERALRPPGREVVLYEITEIGEIDPACPLRLERRLALSDARVFIEALILPCGASEAAELSAILRRHGRSAERHEAALGHVRALEEHWATCCPARTLPCVDLRQDFLITRAADAPLEAEPAAPHG